MERGRVHASHERRIFQAYITGYVCVVMLFAPQYREVITVVVIVAGLMSAPFLIAVLVLYRFIGDFIDRRLILVVTLFPFVATTLAWWLLGFAVGEYMPRNMLIIFSSFSVSSMVFYFARSKDINK
jgi:hypothetical protein